MHGLLELKPIKDFGRYGFPIIILISILASCDPAIGYKYSLNNKSDKELKIYFIALELINDTTKCVIISPKTEILFFDTEVWGKNPHDEKDDFLKMFDTLSITATDSSKLLVNYLKRDSWTYSNDIGHLGFIETGVNMYKLELTNDDFEKK